MKKELVSLSSGDFDLNSLNTIFVNTTAFD